MLSVDRAKFHDGRDAFDYITKKRGIGNFIRNLERTDGIKIDDWVSTLQWHRDGFPHWHIQIQVDLEGRAGMIGQDRLHNRWPFGLYVREEYIRDEDHWKRLLGYFNRHGYFEGGGYQNKLPLWAVRSRDRIKRYEAMKAKRKEGVAIPVQKRLSVDLADKELLSESLRKTNGEIIDGCGMSTKVTVNSLGENPIWLSEEVSVPFRDLADKGGWVYIKGRGLTLEMSVMEYRAWRDEIQITICNVSGRTWTPDPTPPSLQRKKEEAVGSVESDPATLQAGDSLRPRPRACESGNRHGTAERQ
jgi:hypothetical protein